MQITPEHNLDTDMRKSCKTTTNGTSIIFRGRIRTSIVCDIMILLTANIDLGHLWSDSPWLSDMTHSSTPLANHFPSTHNHNSYITLFLHALLCFKQAKSVNMNIDNSFRYCHLGQYSILVCWLHVNVRYVVMSSRKIVLVCANWRQAFTNQYHPWISTMRMLEIRLVTT